MKPQSISNLPNLAPLDGELYLVRRFYQQSDADLLFTKLLSSLTWQEEAIFIFGRRVQVPRLMCWIGDADACYRYSGVNHWPLPWTADLQSVRERVEHQCQAHFNSVLGNLYRDGQDSMGCHADNEKELGLNPLLASLSLGEERLFRLHHKQSKVRLDILLQNGDLLIMAGALQHHWLHSLPKTKKPKAPRINLTFRKIAVD